MTKFTQLADRSLLRIGGSEAIVFLQNLVTCNVENLNEGKATFGGLLSPQGKLLFDFFLLRETDGLLIDVPASQRDSLAKRLMFYRLRADVLIEPVEGRVLVCLDEANYGIVDPRHQSLGRRVYNTDQTANTDDGAYQANRIALGVPESLKDFTLGEVFPHDASMDQFGKAGIDFSKGCYVGQEVVSRMRHRGTARSRIVHVGGDRELPDKGTEIAVQDRSIGLMGSSAGREGLALVRLDRAKKAMDGNDEIVSDGAKLTLTIPEFVSYGWPQ